MVGLARMPRDRRSLRNGESPWHPPEGIIHLLVSSEVLDLPLAPPGDNLGLRRRKCGDGPGTSSGGSIRAYAAPYGATVTD